jgi:acetyl esterase/lipase
MIKSKVLLLTVFSAALLAQTLVAAEAGYDQKMDVVYGEVQGTGLLMDVFTPKGKPNGLAIIDVVSGAYRSDRSKIRDHTLAQVYTILCGRGYVVFALRPGSRTKYTVQEMAANVKTGIRYVKQHSSEYKIDPNRLGLTGASAGGHLAALTAVTPEQGQTDGSALLKQGTQVKAAALFFPPTDLLDWDGKPADYKTLQDLLFPGEEKNHSEAEIKEKARQISPARLVKPPTIPFLLIHGDADPIVPLQQSQKFVEAIKAAGGSAELIVKKGGGHPWFTIPEEVKIMADWFDRKLLEAKSKEDDSQK